MKKMLIACAVVLCAGFFASCGDTNRCYEVTTTVDSIVKVETVTYFWGTKNDLDAYKADLKQTQKDLGIDEKTITIKSVPTTKSQDECHK